LSVPEFVERTKRFAADPVAEDLGVVDEIVAAEKGEQDEVGEKRRAFVSRVRSSWLVP